MIPVIDGFGVILFYTNSAAFRAEKIFLKGGLQAKLIPTPREFSSDCGIALQFKWDQVTYARELLESAHVEFSSMHRLA